MNARRGLVLGAVVAIPHMVFAQQNADRATSHGYSAAFYAAGGYGQNEQSLTIFPLNGKAFSTPIPFALGPFAFSADGKVLYAEGFVGPPGERAGPRSPSSPMSYRLQKIEFNPMRVSHVAGSTGLGQIYSLAVSRLQDKIVVSLGYPYFGDVGCGIFELNLSDGTVRKLLDDPDCAPPRSSDLSGWMTISLSPDGKKAVAIRKHRLELIDLTQATVGFLGDSFVKAAWSPDGKWIAALEDRAEKFMTVLIDTSRFTKRRVLGDSDVKWSPDSRYLLGRQEDNHCKYNFGTLEAVDIDNGRRTMIHSSQCKVTETTTAWVSSEINR